MFNQQTDLFSTDPGKITDFSGIAPSDVFNRVVVPRHASLDTLLRQDAAKILDAPRPKSSFDASLLAPQQSDPLLDSFKDTGGGVSRFVPSEDPPEDYNAPLPPLKSPSPDAVRPEGLKPVGDYNKGSIKLSNYGYASDSSPDYNSNVLKIGNHNNPLIDGVSAALSRSLARKHGLKPGQWFEVVDSDGKVYQRRYDDTVPVSYKGKALPETVDLYNQKGSNVFGGKIVGIRPLTTS